MNDEFAVTLTRAQWQQVRNVLGLASYDQVAEIIAAILQQANAPQLPVLHQHNGEAHP